MVEQKLSKPKQKSAKPNTALSLAGNILLSVLLTAASVAFFTTLWLVDVFPDIVPAELIYHLKAPLAGTSSDMIRYYILHYGLIEFLLPASAIALLLLSRRKDRPLQRLHLPVLLAMAVLSVLGVYGAVSRLESQYALVTYAESQQITDSFIEENYVDPASVALTFPQKKRNLIYIFLESAETTFADSAEGGAMEKDCIPELTQLALENECFNGGSGRLNGGVSLPGTVWTMGAMFAHSSGLPLLLTIDGNDMNTQDSFFPSVSTLGDILAKEGYTNELMVGSDAEFGGRKLYYLQHGGYRIFDYNSAISNGDIPGDYKVWWGYEDEKLFSYARRELTALAKEDAPFNLTLLTVDTHFEDGYVCRLCGDAFGDDQYANVFACSSKQVAAFVEWVQQQDFYENTTIVLAGDHPTMDSDFCADVPSEYTRRVYTAVINGAPEGQSGSASREYDTFDLFPTTLAALGVTIPGDRLGLGANLYGDAQTLIERYGAAECRRRLNLRSPFMETLNQAKLTDALAKEIRGYASLTARKGVLGRQTLNSQVQYDCRNIADIDCIEVEYWNRDDPSAAHRHVALNRYDSSTGHHIQFSLSRAYSHSIAVLQIVKKDGTTVPLAMLDLQLIADSLDEYLTLLSRGDYLVFVAACDDATNALDESAVQHLRRLGAQEDLRGHFRCGYVLAADTSGGQRLGEALSDDGIARISGTADGVAYELESAGYDAGNFTSIRLNGTEYSANKRGLNFVVYHRTWGVVDVVCFDTYTSTSTVMR